MDIKFFRRLKQNFRWFAVNAIGLSVSVACILIIFLHIKKELSYDDFHANSEQIYRLTLETNHGASVMHPARVAGNLPEELQAEYPALEKMARLIPYRRAIVEIGEDRFYTRNAFSTDSTFFDVFDFKVLSGNPKNSLAQPGRAFIAKSLAMKYFGTMDVIGKEISILHQQADRPQNFTVDGVMGDFPENSHFHAELLTSFSTVDDRTTWAYTYYLMRKGTDIEILREAIHKKLEAENTSGMPTSIVHFQKLTDIHLYSHKPREIEKNGDIRSVILLLSGALIILLIALVNYLNLSRVQFISSIKAVKVKLINGASRWSVAREQISESLFLSVFALVVGVVIAHEISRLLKMNIFSSLQTGNAILLAILFIAIIALVSVIPVFSSKITSDIKLSVTRQRMYTVPLIMQFSLAVIAIAGTLTLNGQLNFINRQHPASRDANMLVIADIQHEAVQRYEQFKSELLKDPSITKITAAMEKPGDDILDGMRFEMEGVDSDKELSINIMTSDASFFEFMNIEPLAGTVDLGYTSTHQWEADAVDLSMRRMRNDTGGLAELERKVSGYREKYILNESALKIIGIADPHEAVGKRFRIIFHLPDLFPEGEIVGIVPDFHYTNLKEAEKPLVIVPRKMFNSNFIISIDGNQRERALHTIHTAWQKIFPEYPLEYEHITDTYQKVYAGEYAQTRVLSLFALISLLLASLGIFALASFNMQRRVKEIGIRKVNGAQTLEIMSMLNLYFLKWVAVSFVIALPFAWWVMHKWLQNFAYKINLSWLIFAAAGVIVLVIALLTVSLQSWRAASKNPVNALKYE